MGVGGGKRGKGTCVSPRARGSKGHFRNKDKTRMASAEKTRRRMTHNETGEIGKGQIPHSPVNLVEELRIMQREMGKQRILST